jgi:hypothetical protein
LISLNFILQTIPQFSSYSIYDSKKLFLKIQVGCAAAAFVISLLYIIIFLVCRIKLDKRKVIPKRPDFNAPRAPPVFYANPANRYPYPPY